MKSIKKISIMALGTAIMLGSTAFASTGTVTTDGLRMRKEASTAGEIVTSLDNGAQVEIVEKVGEWYKVKYYDEYEGYLFGEYVKINGEEVEEPVGDEPQGDLQPEVEKPTDNVEEEQPIQEESIGALLTDEPEMNVEEVIYPMETTTKAITKIYMLPLITSSNISEIAADTEVIVQKELNNWVYVTSEEVSGWARKYSIDIKENVGAEPQDDPQVTVEEQPEQENTAENKPEQVLEEQTADISKGYINVSAARIRKKPSTDSDVLEVLTLNTDVKIITETGEWYKIQFNDITGYISKTLISEELTQTSRGNGVRQPDVQENVGGLPTGEQQTKEEGSLENKAETQENVGVAPQGDPQIDVEDSSQDDLQKNKENKVEETTKVSAGQKIVDFAKKYLGYSYVYGGTTPSTGFDCSGFTYYVLNSCGYNISRSCSVQAKSGIAVTKANLEAGDLVFFDNTSDGSIGHVGIYIGNGNFIHAANPTRGVVIDTINSGYYNTYYYSARRVM